MLRVAAMQARSYCLACLTVLAPLTSAQAGWTATQTHYAKPDGKKQSTKLRYDRNVLRVDNPDQTSVLFDLAAGRFTFLQHARKAYASITVEELGDLRKRMIAELRAQLPQMPEAVRGQVQARLDALEKSQSQAGGPKFTATGKSERIGPIACKEYTWKGLEGTNSACVATKLPFDLRPFQTASAALAKKVQAAGAEDATLAMVHLAKLGFPVRSVRSARAGPKTVELVSEMQDLKAATIAKAELSVPTGYKEEAFQSMMERMGAPL